MEPALVPGVLAKLLRANADDEPQTPARRAASSEPQPALLQVTGIIPTVAGPGLFPDRGFYLKVSDSSHAIYAVLPQEHDDLVLSNKLQLGQFIQISRLDLSSPLPLLQGIRPLPGRRPCLASPSHSQTTLSRRHTFDSAASRSLREMALRAGEDSEDSDGPTPSRSLRRSWARPSVSTALETGCLAGEGSALPSSLPSSLIKAGKAAIKHRDLAIFAAVEALQEASASQRAIRLLVRFPELQQQQSERGSIHGIHDFLEFLDEIQAEKSAKAKTSSRNSNSAASDRRKHAISWITAALASGDSPPMNSAADSEIAARIWSSFARSKHRMNGDLWMNGAGSIAAADLAGSLHAECNRWFLSYIEKFLDGVLSETESIASENQIAALLLQIKKVEDWLEKMAMAEPSPLREASREKWEARERVRRKIYSVLLKHVDRAASALESITEELE
ncbi:uncharacterized protein LOC144707166 [Wolffia australiana]